MTWPPKELLVGPTRPIAVSEAERLLFEQVWDALQAGDEHATRDTELSRLLCWITDTHDVLAHGSPSASITRFSPRPQTDWFGRVVTRVFAARDGIWPMFFAILDRARYRGSVRNLFRVDEAGRRRYAFSISRDLLPMRPFSEGSVYLLPGARFRPTVGDDGTVTEEWSTEAEVVPIARVTVLPSDFPYLDVVEGHDPAPSVRLAELQDVVLPFVSAVWQHGDEWRASVELSAVEAAAELIDVLNEVGVPDTAFGFDRSRGEVVISGPGAENTASALKSAADAART